MDSENRDNLTEEELHDLAARNKLHESSQALRDAVLKAVLMREAKQLDLRYNTTTYTANAEKVIAELQKTSLYIKLIICHAIQHFIN